MIGKRPGVLPGRVQTRSTTPSRAWSKSCGGAPPSCIEGKMSILMRPFESRLDLLRPGRQELRLAVGDGRQEVVHAQRHLRRLRVTLAQKRRGGDGAPGKGQEAAAAGFHRCSSCPGLTPGYGCERPRRRNRRRHASVKLRCQNDRSKATAGRAPRPLLESRRLALSPVPDLGRGLTVRRGAASIPSQRHSEALHGAA